ncbi:citramalate synthase [Candidatus Rariloculus sp.]|uniref:citramalate synthase n=1 Tax=Candidatus Rariloculus sp. TaxID=3101265 RepID=UPI003D130D55
MSRIALYDTTLRDGCQSEDVAFTLEDKLRIAEELDACGASYIEGGWPGSNPRDQEFFTVVRKLNLRQAKVAAFGSTRRANTTAEDDLNLRQLLKAQTPVITIVGKTWDLHVRDDLRISHEANLEIIGDSVAYLKQRVDEVFFDAEHFFDGYKADPEFALLCLKAAVEAGADVLVLCDTRGGSMPHEIRQAVHAASKVGGSALGIHCHNDCELAIANSLAAVEAGATQVQGTINGFGERCGNANLCSVIPNLQLKLGYECVSPAQLKLLPKVSALVYELANIEPFKRQAYVGASAFAHKGGLHVAAVQKNSETYEHIDPELIGNRQRVLVSDLSGRSNVIYKAKQFGLDIDYSNPAVKTILHRVKHLESVGYQYEGAEASFELLIQEALGGTRVHHFRLISFRVSDEKLDAGEPPLSEATVKIEGPDGRIEHTVAQGNGPLNALDRALRKALTPFYPELNELELLDYKVRVLGGGEGTQATVRVLIESGDSESKWGTVGVSANVLEASWQALVDSIEYKLYKDKKNKRNSSERASADG